MSEETKTKWVAADLVGKWIYVRGGTRREVCRVDRYFVQATRGDTVLDLAPTARPTSWPQRLLLSEVEIVLVQTREEELASGGPGDTRPGDEQRMDRLQIMHRAGHLQALVYGLPSAASQPDLRRALDAVWGTAPPV